MPKLAALWIVKRAAFLLGAAIEAAEPEVPVLLVWHPEKMKQASAAMSKPQLRQFCFFILTVYLTSHHNTIRFWSYIRSASEQNLRNRAGGI